MALTIGFHRQPNGSVVGLLYGRKCRWSGAATLGHFFVGGGDGNRETSDTLWIVDIAGDPQATARGKVGLGAHCTRAVTRQPRQRTRHHRTWLRRWLTAYLVMPSQEGTHDKHQNDRCCARVLTTVPHRRQFTPGGLSWIPSFDGMTFIAARVARNNQSEEL